MMHAAPLPQSATQAPEVRYRTESPAALLEDPATLAVFGYGKAAPALDDPRFLRVASEPVHAAEAGMLEQWRVAGTVTSGVEAGVRWSEGGGWLYAAISIEQPDTDPAATASTAYGLLARFMAARRGYRVQRMWNLLADINQGEGDLERYKRFCLGRGNSLAGLFDEGYPAATAVGHHDSQRALQVYCLASRDAGQRIENPRQMSAWHYPRQYGPVAPSFARAMRLPAGDALAISGTAAIRGHESRHADDLAAQLAETWANLDALLTAGGMPTGFNPQSPLKVYLRQQGDAAPVDAFLDQHAPGVPRLLLEADICRRELLVEIDGWRYA